MPMWAFASLAPTRNPPIRTPALWQAGAMSLKTALDLG